MRMHRSSASARAALKAEAQSIIDAASRDFERGTITASDWQRRVSTVLASAYLSDDDPRWQSGFDGDAELWRQARELVLDAVSAPGSFLDVGCANGYLLECLDIWSRERGLALTLSGLELNPELADAARRRLPALSQGIYSGNISDWEPPHRFMYVRMGLEYAPPGQDAALLSRVLSDVVQTGGRLIVGPVPFTSLSATHDAFIRANVSESHDVSATDRDGKTRYVVWASADAYRLEKTRTNERV
jgi:hypothetical protein